MTNPLFDRILTRRTELGEGLTIRRALPTVQRRRVGAWCFLDHIGPVQFEGQALANGGLHVGAHPHIGGRGQALNLKVFANSTASFSFFSTLLPH